MGALEAPDFSLVRFKQRPDHPAGRTGYGRAGLDDVTTGRVAIEP